MLRQYSDAEMISKYGKPNQTGTYLTSIITPFKFILAWDTSTKVSKIRVHRLEADNLSNILEDILSEYGIEEILRLGINRFGGSFNYRQMRTANRWSRHSWSTALDLDPDRNKLREDHTTARFAREEYSPMIDIFEKHSWVSLGRLHDMDWMHFEAGVNDV